MAGTPAEEYRTTFRIVLVGDCGVGKSCIFQRFFADTFTENVTIENSAKSRTFKINSRLVTLTILDAFEPADRFKDYYDHPLSTLFRGMHGIVIVYDVTDKASFMNVKGYLKDIDMFAAEHVNKILIGNKCDLTSKRMVDYNEAKLFADKKAMSLFETSAKDSLGIEECFASISLEILNRLMAARGLV